MMLLTIGYEGRSIEDFVAALTGHRVGVLLDIRQNPISRKPGFSKRTLEARLGEAGIGYRHLRALGNPKAIRDSSRSTQEALARFGEHMATQWDEALAPIVGALSSGERPCLLCMERDPACCHRSIVVEALLARVDGLEVTHIR